MASEGCTFKDGECKPALESCEGCKRMKEYPTGIFCVPCPDPTVKWKNGSCNLATHVKTVDTTVKQKVNPIKASKRGH